MPNKTNALARKGRKKSPSPKLEKTEVLSPKITEKQPNNQSKKQAKNQIKEQSKDKIEKKPKDQIKEQPKNQKQPKKEATREHVKKGKSRIRSLFSLSIIIYLIHAFYICGSPFETTTGKPAVCEAINPIKADLYSLYESDLYQKNVNPYVGPVFKKGSELYFDYGIPTFQKLSFFYTQYALPQISQGCNRMHALLKDKLEPHLAKAAPYVKPYYDTAMPYYDAAIPYYESAKPYIIKLQSIRPEHFDGVCKTLNEKLIQFQITAGEVLDQLPSPLYEMKEKILANIQEAETTELIPVLKKIYAAVMDFIQFELIPYVKKSPVFIELKLIYLTHVHPYFSAFYLKAYEAVR